MDNKTIDEIMEEAAKEDLDKHTKAEELKDD